MNRDMLRALSARNCEDVLRVLAKAFDKKGDSPVPNVRLTMGPHAYSGVVVKIEELRTESWLLLFQPGAGIRGTDSVAYLPLKAITSVMVDELSPQVAALLEGSAPPVGGDEIPSRLSVERQAAQAEESIGKLGWKDGRLEIDWSGRETDGQARYRLHRAVASLEKVLREILEEKIGREAMAQIARIVVTATDTASLDTARDGRTLRVSVGAKYDDTEIDQTLKSFLEKAL